MRGIPLMRVTGVRERSPVSISVNIGNGFRWKLISSRTASSSTPPTPQISRKKLELLPRSSTGSTSPSPLSSPKFASNPPRSNPFGAARLVDLHESRKCHSKVLQTSRYFCKGTRSFYPLGAGQGPGSSVFDVTHKLPAGYRTRTLASDQSFIDFPFHCSSLRVIRLAYYFYC